MIVSCATYFWCFVVYFYFGVFVARNFIDERVSARRKVFREVKKDFFPVTSNLKGIREIKPTLLNHADSNFSFDLFRLLTDISIHLSDSSVLWDKPFIKVCRPAVMFAWRPIILPQLS